MIMPTNYGAVQGSNDDLPADRSFDADRAYYLKDSAAPLTSRQKCRRLLSVGFPLVVAVLIMGGFAWFLLKDFNHLYPGRGGGSPDGSGYEHVVPSTGKKALDDGGARPSDPNDATASSGAIRKPTAVGSVATCASHERCAKLGLIGNCCPTDKGVVLECC